MSKIVYFPFKFEFSILFYVQSVVCTIFGNVQSPISHLITPIKTPIEFPGRQNGTKIPIKKVKQTAQVNDINCTK